MHPDIKNICDALDGLANHIIATFPAQNDTLFSDHWGWPAPGVNRREAAAVASNLAADLRRLNQESYPAEMKGVVTDAVRRIQTVHNQTVQYMFNGNIGQAYPAYLATIQTLRDVLIPTNAWVSIPDGVTLPAQLMRKVSAAQRRVEELSTAIPNLSQKISEINEAHTVADNLEVDLQELGEAREKVEKALAEATVITKAIDVLHFEAQMASEMMQDKAVIAEKLIAQCEAAYHITTTKGLAGAFDQRAKSLGWSMRGWVLGLAAALSAGAWIGAMRLDTLARELSTDNPKWPLIVSHIVLAVLGVGAPLWFAWLATKQVGQRFRLAEDYAFKASVAKAYEGYRKEAAQLDPEFQATLFRSALTRLDEAPLRLVEAEHHNSPLQEFVNSDAVKSAFKIAPDLPSKFMNMVNETLDRTKTAAGEAAKVVKEAKTFAAGGEAAKDG